MRSHTMLRAAVPLAATCLLSGCVVSAGPVIAEHEATFDTGLLGAWEEQDSNDRAVISRGGGRVYAITYESDGEEGRFEALLGKIGDRTVLDVWPRPRDRDVANPYDGLMIPGHVLFVVDLDGDRLVLALIDPEALGDAIEDGAVRLTTTETDEQLVLHGGPAEQVAGLEAFLARDEALAEGGTWRRVESRSDRR